MHLTAERLDRIQPSLTIAIATKARHMIAEGKNVISLSQGEPDFDTPRNVKDAAIRAIEAGETQLHRRRRHARRCARRWRQKFKRDSGIDYKPEEIIISTGGKQVIFNAMLATLNAGDEVIIPSPCWVSYPDIVSLADGKPVLVPCEQNHGFKLRAEDLERRSRRDQLVHAEQPVQPDRCGLFGRGAAADLRRAAAPSGCLDLHRRHLREARL